MFLTKVSYIKYGVYFKQTARGMANLWHTAVCNAPRNNQENVAYKHPFMSFLLPCYYWIIIMIIQLQTMIIGACTRYHLLLVLACTHSHSKTSQKIQDNLYGNAVSPVNSFGYIFFKRNWSYDKMYCRFQLIKWHKMSISSIIATLTGSICMHSAVFGMPR